MAHVGEWPETADQSGEIDHIDVLLDEALRETFPGSDPVAISIEQGNRGNVSGNIGRMASIAASNAMDEARQLG